MNRDNVNRNSISEMEQIQRGLEEFLQQELREMKSEETQSQPKPQFFTIGEEENREKEIDVIGSREDFFEDWDSGERGRSGNRSRSGNRGRSENRSRSGNRNRGSSGERMRSREGGKSARRSSTQKNNNSVKKKKSKAAAVDNSKNSRGSKKNPAPKKKSKFKRFLVAVVLIAAVLMAGLYFAVGAVYEKMNFHEIEAVAAAPLKEDGVVNILLIGNDSRKNGEDGRSDGMILLSISSQTKKIYMTSLLRDMYVEIPGHDNNRLNAAYSFGGAELLMETVEQNFDIPVNRYVLVNFEAFANLVDAVGGIELELSGEEIEYVNGYLVEYNMLTNRPQGTDNMDTSVSGLVHLNGPQALAYSRNRYLGTDFGRTERQRKVLSAVIKKLPKAVITNPVELFDGLMPNLTTNLTKQECFRLSLMASKLLTYEMVQASIPLEGTYQNATIRKMSVLEVDFEANKRYLRESVYGSTKE